MVSEDFRRVCHELKRKKIRLAKNKIVGEVARNEKNVQIRSETGEMKKIEPRSFVLKSCYVKTRRLITMHFNT